MCNTVLLTISASIIAQDEFCIHNKVGHNLIVQVNKFVAFIGSFKPQNNKINTDNFVKFYTHRFLSRYGSQLCAIDSFQSFIACIRFNSSGAAYILPSSLLQQSAVCKVRICCLHASLLVLLLAVLQHVNGSVICFCCSYASVGGATRRTVQCSTV